MSSPPLFVPQTHLRHTRSVQRRRTICVKIDAMDNMGLDMTS
jgi:hypothetical protein